MGPLFVCAPTTLARPNDTDNVAAKNIVAPIKYFVKTELALEFIIRYYFFDFRNRRGDIPGCQEHSAPNGESCNYQKNKKWYFFHLNQLVTDKTIANFDFVAILPIDSKLEPLPIKDPVLYTLELNYG